MILAQNIDVSDGLDNGAKGRMEDFLTDEKGQNISLLSLIMKSLDNNCTNMTTTKNMLGNCGNGTPISRTPFSYNLNKRATSEGAKHNVFNIQ